MAVLAPVLPAPFACTETEPVLPPPPVVSSCAEASVPATPSPENEIVFPGIPAPLASSSVRTTVIMNP